MPINVGGVANLTSSFGTELSLTGAAPWLKTNLLGIVTRPQTPYFGGHILSKGTPYNAGGGYLLLTANDNVGNCYNGTNGLFTCPVGGYYMVTGAGIVTATSGYFYIYKNGAQTHFTHWSHSGSWHYISLSGIVLCAAGDYIGFVIGSPSPATAGFYGESGHGMYSIGLMA